jgi:hypothetical protein
MDEIYVNTAKNFTAPQTATTLTIIHELGDTVLSAAAVSSGSVTYTPLSIGTHKLLWKNGSTLVSTEFYSVIQPLVTDLQFFNDYESLEETYGDSFRQTERKVRLVIEKFVNQKFGPLLSKTVDVQGTGGSNLELPYRLLSLTSVQDQWGEELTEYVRVGGGTSWFLEYNSSLNMYMDIKKDVSLEPYNFFRSNVTYSIEGDFGWEYVPVDVSEAAKLLISDNFNGTSDLVKQGFRSAQLGDFAYSTAIGKMGEQWATTGNSDADLLLSEYVVMGIGLV